MNEEHTVDATELLHQTHVVTLICDAVTGSVVYWHRTPNVNAEEAITLWGQPVGTAFGTTLEMWLCFSDRATKFYPAN